MDETRNIHEIEEKYIKMLVWKPEGSRKDDLIIAGRTMLIESSRNRTGEYGQLDLSRPGPGSYLRTQ
jgi:hypothetical protein